jgi:hypothetical protein
MFPRNKVTGVVGGKIQTAPNQGLSVGARAARPEPPKPVNASMGGFGGFGGYGGGAHSMSINTSWASNYQYYMTGLIPADPGYTDSSNLALFYRDCYLFDNVAGSAVDIQSTFPFSDYDLRGLPEPDLDIYKHALDQLNILRMLPEISTAYLVDGFFCGSLVYDEKARKFMDTLIYDALQCTVIPTSFFNLMPEIHVQTGQATQSFLASNSPYSRQYKASLPREFTQMLQQGTFILNPVSTLFVARRSLPDRAYVSFLHRILPMYLIEKTMFRGTLVEAQRRQRAMTHITAGDDVWTPTGEELQAYVNMFQSAESDPLGGWIATRGAVQSTDIRPGGDFWKWTDMADVLVPYKMRALGMSEALLSGDASFAAAESAYSTFLETMNSYRQHLTHSIFYSTLFPLIAVSNNLYKDSANKVKRGQISEYLLNSTNRSNLKIPQLMWHKSLEAKGEENTFELLEQASEKGVPVPLKNWMAAAGLDSDTLLKDLKEDAALRKQLEQFTGKDTSHEGEDAIGEDLEAHLRARLTAQSINSGARTRKPLLSRKFGDPEAYSVSKSGNKKHHVINQRAAVRDQNARIAKIAARAEVDPEYRRELAKRNMDKFGTTKLPIHSDIGLK